MGWCFEKNFLIMKICFAWSAASIQEDALLACLHISSRSFNASNCNLDWWHAKDNRSTLLSSCKAAAQDPSSSWPGEEQSCRRFGPTRGRPWCPSTTHGRQRWTLPPRRTSTSHPFLCLQCCRRCRQPAWGLDGWAAGREPQQQCPPSPAATSSAVLVTEQTSVMEGQQFEQFQRARVLYRRTQSLWGIPFLIPQQQSDFFPICELIKINFYRKIYTERTAAHNK